MILKPLTESERLPWQRDATPSEEHPFSRSVIHQSVDPPWSPPSSRGNSSLSGDFVAQALSFSRLFSLRQQRFETNLPSAPGKDLV